MGHAINLFVSAHTLAFAALVVLDALGVATWTSASFHERGFCVSNADDVHANSHALCFYVDCVGAWIVARLVQRHADVRGVAGSALEHAAPGIAMHGVAHWALARGVLPDGRESPSLARAWLDGDDAMPSAAAVALRYGLVVVFFTLLLVSIPGAVPRTVRTRAATHAGVLVFLAPPSLGFAYVQAALSAEAVVSDVRRGARGEDDEAYALQALLVHLPTSLLAWIEAGLCDVGYRQVGGHVWYDASIPLGMLAYLSAMRAREGRTLKTA